MLKLAFLPYFTMFPVKKGGKPSPPGADHRRKIKVAGLLGQRFFEKIQNGGRRFTLDLLDSEEGHSTILLAHYTFWF